MEMLAPISPYFYSVLKGMITDCRVSVIFTSTVRLHLSLIQGDCTKQPSWPLLPREGLFTTPSPCIIRRDFLFQCSHCLSHPGGSQIVSPSSRPFPRL